MLLLQKGHVFAEGLAMGCSADSEEVLKTFGGEAP